MSIAQAIEIPYPTYLDKVFGCWIGKSIGGTLGAPYEGRKELFDYQYSPSAIAQMLPNDDLDLQVLWLDVIERKGIYFTSDDLADAFARLVPYAPGEYAYFKKNWARGIRPPLSGKFNNRFYIEGMGSPIRSEIWACVCPGNPELAAEFAARDAVLDHAGDSVFAEQMLAAMESAAFFEKDIDRLFDIGLAQLPEKSKIRRLVIDSLRWSREESDWRKVRARIIRDYGHPDCTNLHQNIGFTVLCLIHGKGNFIDSTMMALNCGFDADCSCATAGALLGIIDGAKTLIARHQFYDTSYKLGVHLTRRSDKLSDLAEDVCSAGLAVAAELNRRATITGAPAGAQSKVSAAPRPVMPSIAVNYGEDVPVIGWGQSKAITLTIRNPTAKPLSGRLTIDAPSGWTVALGTPGPITVAAGGESAVAVELAIPKNVRLVHETNVLQAHFDKHATLSFGLNGGVIWRVFGPFWANVVNPPREELGKWYQENVKGNSPDESADLLRQYHLNTVPDLQAGRSLEPRHGSPGASASPPAGIGESTIVSTVEDRISVAELVGFQGPCVVYAQRRIHSPSKRELFLAVGHSDAYQLWLNGELVSQSEQVDWWTAENKHHRKINLVEGENTLLLKCIRHGQDAFYSITFVTGSILCEHISDLGSYAP